MTQKVIDEIRFLTSDLGWVGTLFLLLFSLFVFSSFSDVVYQTSSTASTSIKLTLLAGLAATIVYIVYSKTKTSKPTKTVVYKPRVEIVPNEMQAALEPQMTPKDSYLPEFRSTLKESACEKRSARQQEFFQTHEGEYAEGDVFLGVNIADIVKLSESYSQKLTRPEIKELLKSHVHDERIAAVWLLINRYKSGDAEKKTGVYEFYLENRELINNWDMVDLASRNIIGVHVKENPSAQSVLSDLMKSTSVWDKRSAVMSTHPFVLEGEVAHAFGVVEKLAANRDELVQSALGWVLKESYKRKPEETEGFMRSNFNTLSKQAVRIGTERMDKKYRKEFLRGNFA